MKRNLLFSIFLAVAVAVLTLSVSAGSHGHRGLTVSTSDDTQIESCDDIEVLYDGQPAARAQEQLTIPVSGRPLHVEVGTHGGIYVQGGEAAEFSVLACKATRPGAGAEERLRELVLQHPAGQLRVEGPDDDSWAALIIRAPQDSSLELEATNGPLSVYNFSGKISAQSVNGPISAAQFQGEFQAKAENGPITFEDSGGDLRLQARNGPITVELTGSRWQGQGLEGRTENGPITVRLPAGYQSGVLVEGSGYSPMHCDADVCGPAQRTWDNRARRIQFGEAPAVVRLYTVNGPVTVESNRHSRRRRTL